MEIQNEELLKYITEHGIIDINAVQRNIEMSRQKKYLEMHPYNIWLGKDGSWHTYLPKEHGRQHVKKKERESIEHAIIEYWKSVNNHSFKTRFEVWMDRQETCGRRDTTIVRYISDYKRFFAGYPIEKEQVENITDSDIMKHFKKVLEDKDITYKALKGAFGYVKGVFKKCTIDKIIDPNRNPCQFVDIEMLRQFCKEKKKKTAQERTLSDKERKILLNKLENPDNANGNPVVYFAVQLSLYTGMRVGELAGLMWEDIDWENNIINIRHQEVHEPRKKRYIITNVKNGKERIFPLTTTIRELLIKCKHYQEERNFLGEFVFQDADGKLHPSKISDCARNKTMSSDFSSPKSVHAIRRTFNSNLKRLGVSTPDASALVGNTERVNEEHYTYSITTINEKKSFVEAAGKIS